MGAKVFEKSYWGNYYLMLHLKNYKNHILDKDKKEGPFMSGVELWITHRNYKLSV